MVPQPNSVTTLSSFAVVLEAIFSWVPWLIAIAGVLAVNRLRPFKTLPWIGAIFVVSLLTQGFTACLLRQIMPIPVESGIEMMAVHPLFVSVVLLTLLIKTLTSTLIVLLVISEVVHVCPTSTADARDLVLRPFEWIYQKARVVGIVSLIVATLHPLPATIFWTVRHLAR
jgi:hypothetical protein